jgi:YbbR domain-containing protein
VTVQLRPVTGTRTFSAGVKLLGARSDLTYAIPVESVLLTVGGTLADLDRLSASTLVAELDVAGLGPGTTDVPVTANLPAGTTLVAANPPSVKVTITAPPPSASPAASPAGSAVP